MSQGKRPGGLTALAVINFIFGGKQVLGGLTWVAMYTGAMPGQNDEIREFASTLRAWPLAWFAIALMLLEGVLLLASGIGYLRQRRIQGRVLGNAYAVTGLARVGVFATAFPPGFIVIVDVLYPVLTLLLINLTFREDFVHRGKALPRPPPAPVPTRPPPVPVPFGSEPVGAPPRSRARDRLLTGLRLSHVRMIAFYWVRFSLRTGGGLVTLLLVLMVGFSVAAMFFAPVEKLMAEAPGLGHREGEAVAYVKRLSESPEFANVVERVTGADEQETRYLLTENPALLSAIFLVLMWFFPFLACIGAFNQTAGDIGSRGLRYLLLRTERPNVLAGRFVGTMGAAKVATAVTFVVMLLYIAIKFRVYAGTDLLLWGLQGFIAVVLLVLPYVAMCTWISCSMDSAFGALALCLVATGGPIIFVKVLDASVSWDLAWMERLIPWGWKYELLSGDLVTRVIAYAVMLGFALLFLFLAFRSFHKRDL